MSIRFNWGDCGPRGFDKIPEAILAAGAGRGWGGSWGPGGFNFEFGGGRGGRRGQRRRMFESGELRLVLLKLIADQPRHGYDLIRAIEEMTGGAYAPSPGVVYPTLTMLQDMGLIEEASAEGARKAFAATAEGKAELEAKADEVEALLERLGEMAPDRQRHGAPPIKRAVANLLSALWHRIAQDEMEESKLHEIAAILDEAAQKIERLK